MAIGQFSVRGGTRTGNFFIPLSINAAVSGLTTANLNAVAVDGKGITGVSFAVNGSGASYNIIVNLPAVSTGRFRLSLQGMVTTVGSGVTEAVTSNEVTIAYDTASSIAATWGAVEYNENGEVVLPVVFGEDITYLHKTDFTLETTEGGELTTLAKRAAVNAAGTVPLASYRGFGRITIKNSDAGAGAYMIAGMGVDGNSQTETLTFAADDDEMTTANSYISAGIRIDVALPFGAGITADVWVMAVPFIWGVIDDYWLVQRLGTDGNVDDRTFYLHIRMLPGSRGKIRVSLTGYVWKTAETVRDDISIAPIEIPYSTIEPEVKDRRVVRTGERIDVILQYEVPCTMSKPADVFNDPQADRRDFIDYDGEDLADIQSTGEPLPNFYRKVDAAFPTLPLPDELPETDWTNMGLTTENATIYLLRWTGIDESVDFNITIKPGFVQGPVS